MGVDKLTGLKFFENNDFIVRDFTGFKFQYIENLAVIVIDQFGEVVNNAPLRVTRNGVPQDLILTNGEYFELVESSINFDIRVPETDTFLESNIEVFVFDGSFDKSIVLQTRVAYYYRVRAFDNERISAWSDPAKLQYGP